MPIKPLNRRTFLRAARGRPKKLPARFWYPDRGLITKPRVATRTLGDGEPFHALPRGGCIIRVHAVDATPSG